MSRTDIRTYMTELEMSRNRLRGDIINLYRDQVDTHALAAALEQENDQLKVQIASAKSHIAEMENILKEQGVYASNHVESRTSKLKPVIADRTLIDISDEDEIQLDLGGRVNGDNEEGDHQFQKGKGNQHLNLTKECRKHTDQAATSGENGKRRKLIASTHIKPKDGLGSQKPASQNVSVHLSTKPGNAVSGSEFKEKCIRIEISIATSLTRHCAKILDVFPRVKTSRRQLMGLYGGSGTHLLQGYPLIKSKICSKTISVFGASQSRRRIFAFPSSMPELNAHFPTRPGDHGLMFGMNQEIEAAILKNDGQIICEIFAPALEDRFCNSRKAIEYFGTYRISESRTMTVEEFIKQTKAVQEAIASKIVDIGPGGTLLYLHMKARSARRKAGKKKIDKRWPTDTAEQRRHLHQLGNNVEDEDIIRDLANGDEKMPILLLECVQYDKDLAASMLASISATDD